MHITRECAQTVRANAPDERADIEPPANCSHPGTAAASPAARGTGSSSNGRAPGCSPGGWWFDSTLADSFWLDRSVARGVRPPGGCKRSGLRPRDSDELNIARLVPGAVALGYKLTWWMQRPVDGTKRIERVDHCSVAAHKLAPQNQSAVIRCYGWWQNQQGVIVPQIAFATHPAPYGGPNPNPAPPPKFVCPKRRLPRKHLRRRFWGTSQDLRIPCGLRIRPLFSVCGWAQVGAAGLALREGGAGQGVGGSTSCGGCARQPLNRSDPRIVYRPDLANLI